jgi:hypothetical protein
VLCERLLPSNCLCYSWLGHFTPTSYLFFTGWLSADNQLSLILFFRLPCRTDLLAPVVFHITLRHGPRRQHSSFLYANRFRGNVFIEPFPSSCRLFSLIKYLLPSNGRRSIVSFATVVYKRKLFQREPFASNECFSGYTVLAFANMLYCSTVKMEAVDSSETLILSMFLDLAWCIWPSELAEIRIIGNIRPYCLALPPCSCNHCPVTTCHTSQAKPRDQL